jgi:exodeoxyribonuclease V gamma subunit
MVPMRSIPARVIGLLGMNANDFPRSQQPLGFDLIARQPRRGDRSRRNDDRYLFLEALLSAREVLHISYVGRDLRDNAVKVPSVVVAELLDVIDRADVLPGDDSDLQARLPSRRLIVEHPLQPFSPRCFARSDPTQWSYADDWLAVARSGILADSGGPMFADAELPAEVPDQIELTDLIRFLRAPSRWFLENRLRLRMPWEEGAPAPSEPFALDNLERWSLGQRLLQLQPAEMGDAGRGLLCAEGILPHGEAGRVLFRREAERIERFRSGLDRLAAPVLEPIEIDLSLDVNGPAGSVRLQGWLDGVTGAGLKGHRLGRLKAKDLLALWVPHLLLNLLAPAGVEPNSAFLSEDKDGLVLTRLSPVADPAPPLTELVRLYLSAHRAPLPLFPECSLIWTEQGDMAKVRDAWNDGFGGRPGEGSDAAVRIAFRGHPDPLGDRFRQTALQVFGPLLQALDGDPA